METLTFNESQLCSIYVFFGSEVPNYIFTSQKVAQQPFFFFWSRPFELLSPGLPWLLGIIRVSRDTSSFTFSLILSRGFVWLMWIISGSKTSSYLAIFFPKISSENWFAARQNCDPEEAQNIWRFELPRSSRSYPPLLMQYPYAWKEIYDETTNFYELTGISCHTESMTFLKKRKRLLFFIVNRFVKWQSQFSLSSSWRLCQYMNILVNYLDIAVILRIIRTILLSFFWMMKYSLLTIHLIKLMAIIHSNWCFRSIVAQIVSNRYIFQIFILNKFLEFPHFNYQSIYVLLCRPEATKSQNYNDK